MLLRSYAAFSWRMRYLEYFAAENIMRYFAHKLMCWQVKQDTNWLRIVLCLLKKILQQST